MYKTFLERRGKSEKKEEGGKKKRKREREWLRGAYTPLRRCWPGRLLYHQTVCVYFFFLPPPFLSLSCWCLHFLTFLIWLRASRASVQLVLVNKSDSPDLLLLLLLIIELSTDWWETDLSWTGCMVMAILLSFVGCYNSKRRTRTNKMKWNDHQQRPPPSLTWPRFMIFLKRTLTEILDISLVKMDVLSHLEENSLV